MNMYSIAFLFSIMFEVAQIYEMFTNTTLPQLKSYETIVETCQFQLNNDPNHVVFGKISINSNIQDVVQIYTQKFQNVSNDSNKLLKNQFLHAKQYFTSSSEESAFEKLNSVTYKLHQVAKSPVPLIVAHRQLYLEINMQNNNNKIIFTMKSVENDFCEEWKNAVTGNCHGIVIVFSKINQTLTEVKQYFWIDPNGNIPSKIYNLGLNQSNDFLLLLKRCCEEKIKLD